MPCDGPARGLRLTARHAQRCGPSYRSPDGDLHLRNFEVACSFSRGMRLKSAFAGLGSRWCWTTQAAVFMCATAMALGSWGLGSARAAGSPAQAILDQCTSGYLSPGYTVAQLEQAMTIMPPSTMQYTSCPDVVQAALTRAQHHQGRAANISSEGSFLPVPVIAIVMALLLGAASFGVVAFRRR
jgi:hypothetical protein